MGIIRKLRQWREREDGTLEGPALELNGSEIFVQSTEPDADDGDVWIRNE